MLQHCIMFIGYYVTGHYLGFVFDLQTYIGFIHYYGAGRHLGGLIIMVKFISYDIIKIF